MRSSVRIGWMKWSAFIVGIGLLGFLKFWHGVKRPSEVVRDRAGFFW